MRTQSIFSALALVLALGLAFVGCDDGATGGGGGGTDRALNGSWYQDAIFGYNFDNGIYTVFDDGPLWRGSYTTSGNQITMTPAEYYINSYLANDYNTTEGWKNKSQATEIFQRNGWSERDINQGFAPMIATYSINGNYLYLIYEGRSYTHTFTRR